jgi:DNA-binding Xre family transcriptional regulator
MIICTLKRVLKRIGWSRYKLQQESKITYPTFHSLYHGKINGYSTDVFNRLCATLHCKPEDLLKWEPDGFPRFKKRNS